MLSKPSSAFPAPVERQSSGSAIPVRPSEVKQELQPLTMSRSTSNRSYGSSASDLVPIKQELAYDSDRVSNGKRKYITESDEDIKMEDFKIEDLDSDVPSKMADSSGRST